MSPDAAGASGPDGASVPMQGALAALEHLDQRPLSEHVEAFDRVHRALQDTLATLDEA